MTFVTEHPEKDPELLRSILYMCGGNEREAERILAEPRKSEVKEILLHLMWGQFIERFKWGTEWRP